MYSHQVCCWHQTGRSGWYIRELCCLPEGPQQAREMPLRDPHGVKRQGNTINEIGEKSLVGNKPVHQCVLRTNELENSCVEKGQLWLVGCSWRPTLMNNYWTWASHVPLQQRWPVASWAALEGVWSADQGSVFSPLLSMDEAKPGILCPVLGSSVRERHGHTGESLAKSH